MEDRQRVFIRGVEDRGNEVIETLVNLGGKNNLVGVLGNNSSCIYFINHDGYIKFTDVCSEIGRIIVDYYQEIKLPKQWRDGNILFSETDNEFAVFEVNHIHYPDKFFSHLSTCHAGYLTNQLMHKRDFRLATESEIEQFHNRLHAVNKDWDTEKKRLINWEWRPIINEAYYTLEIDRGDVEVRTRVYFNNDIDKKLIKNCNFFRTIKEAEEAVERIKKALKGE